MGARLRMALSAPALHVGSGYGIQARHLAQRAAADGHDVAVFAYYGHRGAILDMGGIPHYPPGRLEYNADVLEDHVAHFKPDVLVVISDLVHQDVHAYQRIRAAGVQVLAWMPIHETMIPGRAAESLGRLHRLFLQLGGATPVAMSRAGEALLRAAGFDPLYVPHSADTAVFRPPADAKARQAARDETGIGRKFCLAVNAMNADLQRKGFWELYRAFASFHAKHPESCILLHSDADGQFDHASALGLLGLDKAVLGTPGYWIKTGMMSQADMARWYGLADAYVCSSWAEGFGVPLIEAAACGLPLIGTDCSAVREHVHGSGGWLVKGEPKWDPIQAREWRCPRVDDLAAQMGRAYATWKTQAWAARQLRARDYALGYDADEVYGKFWRPVLARAGAGEFRTPVDDTERKV